jgi:hypothetical protein
LFFFEYACSKLNKQVLVLNREDGVEEEALPVGSFLKEAAGTRLLGIVCQKSLHILFLARFLLQ